MHSSQEKNTATRMCLLEVRDKLDQANIVLDKHRIRSCKLALYPTDVSLFGFRL